MMTVRTTAYSCKECEKGGIYGNKNACGTVLRYGAVRSAAADLSRYPVGTKFRIAGQPQLYVIDDYGSALVGTNTIDIYKPTLGMMKDWGVRHVDIEVVEWGSLARSAEILKARTHFSHTRTMYYAINAKLNNIATRPGATAASRKRG
jgi:3D (Asp-Asp-Asp) domain-containing protein